MYNKILLIGGGGHCKSVIDTLLKTNQYSDIGVIDQEENIGESVLGVPIIGCDEDLSRLYKTGFNEAFVTVGSVGNPKLRLKLFILLEKIGFKIPNIVDRTAHVSNQAKLDNGIFIGKNTVINAGSFIHNGAIINTSAVIEHDCIIEEFSHIAPGAVLCGHVRIGAKTHIGAKSVIKQQISIGSNTMIGMGSVVLNDIGNGVVAYGNPCKEV
ncbi:acetyltransferase [Bacillus sp. EB106-08-02-XG196]|jgi:sugar O-acyltransferase (sialic acid O-acetyltransferase NeuD family)|uniref:acetyltransferase n=1 Tax=Bacillus sp. EB106-08-02-XG196 TaxID=2737049 RepID=UPI0015C47F9C|nr:acetyltransferase [Bacillus sp. EB106-08-02-XG196]NWQ39156.1 acetyltransferase [Bacillus sp. EB106-08-02-XG196]